MIFHFAIYPCDSLGRVEPANKREKNYDINFKYVAVDAAESNVCTNWETPKLIKLNHNNSNKIKCWFLVREENRKTRTKPLGAEWRSFKLTKT